MERHLGTLSGIKFGELDTFHQFEVRNLAQEIGVEIEFENEDAMALLADWHKCEESGFMKERIEAVSERIMHASGFGMHAAHPDRKQEQHQAPVRKLDSFMNRSMELSEKYGFRTHVFEPRKKSAKAIVDIIEQATRPNKAYTLAGKDERKRIEEAQIKETEHLCDMHRLRADEKAFVLNVAHVYWKAFENEPDLRESPKAMVHYLLEEPVARIKENGYGSYFISLMKDGKPAGFVTGAVSSLNALYERFGQPRLEKDITATFVGYVALSRESQGKGGDAVVLAELERMVEANGLKTDYFMAQVDKPGGLGGQINEIGERIARFEKLPLKARKTRALASQKDSLEFRERASRMLLRIWQGRYELGAVEGLKSMEIIFNYNSDKAKLDLPQEQPPLELLIRPRDGGTQMPYADVESLVKGLYMYYMGVPGRTLKANGADALSAYIDYSMKDVPKTEMVNLGRVEVGLAQ